MLHYEIGQHFAQLHMVGVDMDLGQYVVERFLRLILVQICLKILIHCRKKGPG